MVDPDATHHRGAPALRERLEAQPGPRLDLQPDRVADRFQCRHVAPGGRVSGKVSPEERRRTTHQIKPPARPVHALVALELLAVAVQQEPVRLLLQQARVKAVAQRRLRQQEIIIITIIIMTQARPGRNTKLASGCTDEMLSGM